MVVHVAEHQTVLAGIDYVEGSLLGVAPFALVALLREKLGAVGIGEILVVGVAVEHIGCTEEIGIGEETPHRLTGEIAHVLRFVSALVIEARKKVAAFESRLEFTDDIVETFVDGVARKLRVVEVIVEVCHFVSEERHRSVLLYQLEVEVCAESAHFSLGGCLFFRQERIAAVNTGEVDVAVLNALVEVRPNAVDVFGRRGHCTGDDVMGLHPVPWEVAFYGGAVPVHRRTAGITICPVRSD